MTCWNVIEDDITKRSGMVTDSIFVYNFASNPDNLRQLYKSDFYKERFSCSYSTHYIVDISNKKVLEIFDFVF